MIALIYPPVHSRKPSLIMPHIVLAQVPAINYPQLLLARELIGKHQEKLRQAGKVLSKI